MNDDDRSYVIRLFAKVASFIVSFVLVAIVLQFASARLMGLSVDVDKFYAIIGPPLFTVLGAILSPFSSSGKKD